MLDLWVPLSMGAHVVIASAAEMKDFARVRDLISKHKVAAFTGVPSSLQVCFLYSALDQLICRSMLLQSAE